MQKMFLGLTMLLALAAVAGAATHWVVGVGVVALPVAVTYVRLKVSPSYRATADQDMETTPDAMR